MGLEIAARDWLAYCRASGYLRFFFALNEVLIDYIHQHSGDSHHNNVCFLSGEMHSCFNEQWSYEALQNISTRCFNFYSSTNVQCVATHDEGDLPNVEQYDLCVRFTSGH